MNVRLNASEPVRFHVTYKTLKIYVIFFQGVKIHNEMSATVLALKPSSHDSEPI